MNLDTNHPTWAKACKLTPHRERMGYQDHTGAEEIIYRSVDGHYALHTEWSPRGTLYRAVLIHDPDPNNPDNWDGAYQDRYHYRRVNGNGGHDGNGRMFRVNADIWAKGWKGNRR